MSAANCFVGADARHAAGWPVRPRGNALAEPRAPRPVLSWRPACRRRQVCTNAGRPFRTLHDAPGCDSRCAWPALRETPVLALLMHHM